MRPAGGFLATKKPEVVDDRLEAGRLHLRNGERAFAKGYLDEGRAYYEHAMLQFRGPELRLGEAHALRGIARIEHRLGRLDQAERRLLAAAAAYEDLLEQLLLIDPENTSEVMREDARRGGADALRLLSEVRMRAGRRDDATEALRRALRLAEPLGEVPFVAELWAAFGRIAARGGEHQEAEEHVIRAAKLHGEHGDTRGAVEAWLTLADMRRVRGDRDEAEAALLQAQGLADALDDPRLAARLKYSLGAVMASARRHDLARSYFQQALPKAREAEDDELEGYVLLGLGDVASREQDGKALDHLLEGARAMQRVGHVHGISTALLRIGEHGLRDGRYALALAASRTAWLLCRSLDPVVGVGQALRVVVDALAGLRAMKPALTAAVVRAEVVGESQPKAQQVAAWYRGKASAEWNAELDRWSRPEREARLAEYLDRILHPVLAGVNATLAELDDAGGAVEVVSRLRGLEASGPGIRTIPPDAE